MYLYLENVSQVTKFDGYERTAASAHEYVLQVYHRLLALNEPRLESLKVGARVDIGFAPDSKEFFVNELARWHDADFFSRETLGPPWGAICEEYAGAIDSVYLGGSISTMTASETRRFVHHFELI
ncbi:hypothetical protein BDV96DRAFT_607687 [Lophiotrema nucula]|uniref:Uncharacterized protein n=1 Tax=Lophiotrema nucula TaxID=690887 RepID=A0A6A5YIS2_9PLEO|nr:hypothetical protein BDV96DRAFT_607687 [Lophiotrema nucula]